jgi:hypothetical protein
MPSTINNIKHGQGINAAKGQKSQRANNETDKKHPMGADPVGQVAFDRT